ncbi:MAG: hypothetical protein LBR28_07415 [Bacteroidales bacterium]|jgi:hypothetical protein|nr:hypothetical protein [Bacteroidales bacterium]
MKKYFFTILCFVVFATNLSAQSDTVKQPKILDRLQIGGYGEAVMSRMFYSNNYKRYTNSELYKDDKGFGQFDLPHIVFFIGYDFGKGWQFGSEIEFEHGGFEGAIEIEEEETGEYESETERGGEIAIEQWWLEKTFTPFFNIRLGHIIVPVGQTNKYHFPVEFFTVYRPESETAILPCTWHETGIELYGKNQHWQYEIMFIAGLDADRFGSKKWIASSSGSPYEFKIATDYAGAFRLENSSFSSHLRLGISGYFGKSASNSLKSDKYKNVKGYVSIGGFDFDYNNQHFIARGSLIYGHLTDSKKITAINMASRSGSPSPKTPIASDAFAAGIEAGYNVLHLFSSFDKLSQKLYLFSRYEFYDPMLKMEEDLVKNDCWQRQQISIGLNYFPIREIVIKAQYGLRIFDRKYNNEPTISLGIAYSGMFNR